MKGAVAKSQKTEPAKIFVQNEDVSINAAGGRGLCKQDWRNCTVDFWLVTAAPRMSHFTLVVAARPGQRDLALSPQENDPPFRDFRGRLILHKWFVLPLPNT